MNAIVVYYNIRARVIAVQVERGIIGKKITYSMTEPVGGQ